MKDVVAPLREVLVSVNHLNRFGEILHKGWEMKRSLTEDISSTSIDDYYDKALKAGALGGKLLGAGGGGFLLFYAQPKNRQSVIRSLSDLYQLEFGFDSAGTRITYYDQSNI